MNKKLFLFGILFFTLFAVFAQTEKKLTEFSRQTLLFSEEVTDYFKDIRITDPKTEKTIFNGRKMVKAFTKKWEAGLYTNQQQQDIYTIANLMLQQEVRRYPDMTNFFKTLIGFPASNQDPTSFSKWAEGIKLLLHKKDKGSFSTFIRMSDLLINDSTISKYKRLRWQTLSLNYSFDLENDQPIVRFPDSDLSLTYNKDEVVIHNTKGILYPLQSLFIGSGGFVYWDRVNLPRKNVYAELKSYNFDIYSSTFHADSVTYYNTLFFEEPIIGSFTDQAKALLPVYKARFPVFKSYTYDNKIKKLYDGFDYYGGVEFYGLQLEGVGTDTSDAVLSYTTEKENTINLISNRFFINEEFIMSDEAASMIIIEDDSIFHPGQSLVFKNRERLLQLTRTGSFLAETPYSDSYHKVDITAEALYWNLNDSLMIFRRMEGISNKSQAMFESQNRFNDQEFQKIRGIDAINPLSAIYNLSEDLGGAKTIAISALTNLLKKPPDQVQMLLITLTTKGFVLINPTEETFTINNKLFDYVKSYNRSIDYDNIFFFSSKTAINAEFNINSFDMKINNVPGVMLSDSQMVLAIPFDKRITLKKNRDFIYTGQTMAGMFDLFQSTPAHFSYDTFNITMPYIDSIKISVYDYSGNRDPEFGYPSVELRSVLESLKGEGELFIDLPNNKSGLKKDEKYAYLEVDTTDKSAVYYYNAFYPNVYPREKFRFQVWPFNVENLTNFNTDDFPIKGQLLSNNILPDIKKPLRVRPDYSLGFVDNTPPTGFPVYGGKGDFTGLIDLSLNGLRGDGELTFLNAFSKTDTTSIWDSTDYVFLPDSTIGLAMEFTLAESTSGVEFPPVTGKDVWQRWYHKDDYFTINTVGDSPLDMYNGRTKFYGKIGLRPTGLSGDGLIAFDNAELESDNFDFRNTTFQAPNSLFRIFQKESKNIAFSADDYNAYIDFNTDIANFEANKASNVKFPVNSYMSTMYNFDWDIQAGDVELFADNKIYKEIIELPHIEMINLYEAGMITGPELISTRDDQDSLHFFAYRARFTLENNMLDVQEVPFIPVADAYTFPNDGKVLIEENAEMLHLENSEFLTKSGQIIHEFYNSDIKIHTANNYFAVADYKYFDSHNNQYTILFDDIQTMQTLDNSIHTIGKAKIADTSEFMISPYFDFYGNLELRAQKQFINFQGYFQVNYDCDTNHIPAITMDTLIDPMDPVFPITDFILSENDKPVFSGMGFNSRDMQIYTQFLKPEKNRKDSVIFESKGLKPKRFCYF